MENFWFWVLTGLYNTLTRVYDLFKDISLNYAQEYDKTIILSTATTMYVIAGVFMLFRVTISMINYLIDPDKLNDRQAGAGKVLVRIVTSIILLILLQPSGLVFGSNGILMRIENAFIGEKDSFFSELLGFSDKSSSNQLFVDNVYADDEQKSSGRGISHDELTCYYLSVDKNKYDSSKGYNIISINGKYKITFSKTSGNNKTKMVNRDIWFSFNKGDSISYINSNNQSVSSIFNSSLPGYNAIKDSDNVFYKEIIGGCPKSITKNRNARGYDAHISYPEGNSIDTCHLNTFQKINDIEIGPIGLTTSNCKNVGLMGFDSLEEMESALRTLSAKNVIVSNDAYINSIANQNNYSADSWKFSRNVAKSFQQCRDESADVSKQTYDEIMTYCEKGGDAVANQCACLQINMFDGSGGDSIATEKLGEKIVIDYVSSIIAAVAIIAFLIYLCIEVFVRRFKLLLLEMIAPIPIISYSDPNDKMFGQWSKMYISVYLDLFIKLFGIFFAIKLLDSVETMIPELKHPIIMFFYIVAILVFAKAVPTIISKIFGLDSGASGSSFKDIFGMGKAALGFGAGAAIGGVVGAATGSGLGRLTGAFKGAARGAGSGSKGNILGGASSIAKSNYYDNAAKKAGLGFFDRKIAAFTGTLGIQDEYQKAEKNKKRNDEFIGAGDSLEKEAENRVQQAISSGKYRNVAGAAGDSIRRLVDIQNIAHSVANGEKIKKWDGDFSADGNSATYVNKLTGETKTFNRSDYASEDKFINAVSSFQNENISYYDAQSQLYGANLKAKKEMIKLTRNNDDNVLRSLGIDDNGISILKDRLEVADVYAKRAGFDEKYAKEHPGAAVGYSSDNKEVAERNSRAAAKTMVTNEISHLYGQQNK